MACIYNGYKSYGRKSTADSTNVVLNNFTMNVPKGCLYSLLGSSGSGKTTVLSCVVGLTKLNNGQVYIFGNSNVRSQLKRVGYMPQEISLFRQFTILETFMYFGGLFANKRTNSSLEEKAKFLKQLLFLPEMTRVVGTLSGGQCRRVSLAVALIHEPELLLLDEPTGGVDPLVRECIWKHLRSVVDKTGTTVLLTTHYIDEAKGSDVVGIIRDGKMIAEKSPGALLRDMEADFLEDAFLKLCKGEGNASNSGTTHELFPEVSSEPSLLQISPYRIFEVSKKNFKILSRSISMLLFIVAIPAFCMFITCKTLQHDAVGIKLGVHNMEAANCSENNTWPCRTDQLSCSFLREIPGDVINLKYYSTYEEANAAIKKGNIWGILRFPENFSDAWINRVLSGPEEMNSTWNNTYISVTLDQTNTILYGIIMKTLYETVEGFASKTLSECGQDERNGKFPLQYSEPIVGDKTMTGLHYIAPGLAIGIFFFFPFTVSIRLISEKQQGILDRSLASGIEVWEILIAYMVTECCVLLCQAVLVYTILHYGFSLGASALDSPGNVLLTLALCILQGICALTFGFLLGILCKNEAEAALITIAIIFPSAFISGILWPREGMPNLLQIISTFVPMAMPAEALRSLMIRQWSIDHERVWQGFLVPTVFILLNSILLSIIIMRRGLK